MPTPVSAVPAQPRRPVVVLDPGHGGHDGGAKGINGLWEKDANLAVAVAVKPLLEALGITVYLTRQSDTDLGGDPYSLDADLSARAAFAAKLDADLFLSLHADTSDILSAHGVHCIQSLDPQRQPGDLAAHLVAAVCALTGQIPAAYGDGGVWTRTGSSPTVDYYAVIRESTCPALILERGFLSHPVERGNLFDPAFVRRQAIGIAAAVAAHFGASA